MTKNNSTNWARFSSNRYEGEMSQPPKDSVRFILYDGSHKNPIAIIPSDKVEDKKVEWTNKGITFKQLTK